MSLRLSLRTIQQGHAREDLHAHACAAHVPTTLPKRCSNGAIAPRRKSKVNASPTVGVEVLAIVPKLKYVQKGKARVGFDGVGIEQVAIGSLVTNVEEVPSPPATKPKRKYTRKEKVQQTLAEGIAPPADVTSIFVASVRGHGSRGGRGRGTRGNGAVDKDVGMRGVICPYSPL